MPVDGTVCTWVVFRVTKTHPVKGGQKSQLSVFNEVLRNGTSTLSSWREKLKVSGLSLYYDDFESEEEMPFYTGESLNASTQRENHTFGRLRNIASFRLSWEGWMKQIGTRPSFLMSCKVLLSPRAASNQ